MDDCRFERGPSSDVEALDAPEVVSSNLHWWRSLRDLRIGTHCWRRNSKTILATDKYQLAWPRVLQRSGSRVIGLRHHRSILLPPQTSIVELLGALMQGAWRTFILGEKARFLFHPISPKPDQALSLPSDNLRA